MITFPGARRPDRQRWVTDHGLRLSVWEWGDAENVMKAWSKLAAERLSAWTKGAAKPA